MSVSGSVCVHVPVSVCLTANDTEQVIRFRYSVHRADNMHLPSLPPSLNPVLPQFYHSSSPSSHLSIDLFVLTSILTSIHHRVCLSDMGVDTSTPDQLVTLSNSC